MVSHDWRIEIENMLAAFNHQVTHSLSIIQFSFNRSGLSFTPEFKKYFMHASTSRINEAYDQFQVRSMFELQLNTSLNSVANITKRSARHGSNGVECETDDRGNSTSIEDESDWKPNPSSPFIQINDPVYDEVVIDAVGTESTDDPTAIKYGIPNLNRNEIQSDTIITQNTSDAHDDGYGVNEFIAHQLNVNESITDSDGSSDVNFEGEVDDSNDSVEMIENQNDSTDADDDEPTMELILDETTTAKPTKAKNKATQLKHKNPHKKRMLKMAETIDDGDNVVIKGGRSSSKQLGLRTQKKCSVCGYVTFQTGHFNIHMRIHTGEKPHRCDRCGSRFKSTTTLMKHAATHIAEFPFHCRACFQGFSSKVEATVHEKRCKKRHFECYLCNTYVTLDKAELTTHMRKHTGDKPFRCEICSMTFGQRPNLKRHLNNIHS